MKCHTRSSQVCLETRNNEGWWLLSGCCSNSVPNKCATTEISPLDERATCSEGFPRELPPQSLLKREMFWGSLLPQGFSRYLVHVLQHFDPGRLRPSKSYLAGCQQHSRNLCLVSQSEATCISGLLPFLPFLSRQELRLLQGPGGREGSSGTAWKSQLSSSA